MSAVAMASAAEPSTSAVRNRIVAFVNDDLSAAALSKGLEGTKIEVKSGTVRNAVKMLQSDKELYGLIVDVSGFSDPLVELEELRGLCPPDVLVGVVGDRDELSFYRTIVTDLGAREYLAKPLTRDMVQRNLLPKFGGVVDTLGHGGSVVSVCGAQGGAGTTSIACNLGLSLAETTGANVALLDLHLQGGEMAVMLNAQPGPGLRLALENPDKADTLFIERAAIDVSGGKVKLIAGSEKLHSRPQITEQGVRHVIALLRQRFNYVVVDVPALPLVEEIRPVITLSRHVLVMLEAEVTGLRNARELHEAIASVAGKNNRVFTVLNRANRAGGLPMDSIVGGLGQKPDMVIPDLGKGMTQAVNLGTPALHSVKGLRRALAPIVQEITGIGVQKKSFVRRLLGR